MERNRRIAKAYARVPLLTINGADNGFDGFKIGEQKKKTKKYYFR